MNMFRPSYSVILLSCLALGPLAGAGNFALTIDNIMRGPNLVGTEPAQTIRSLRRSILTSSTAMAAACTSFPTKKCAS